jgi:trans-aconitate methyltransferase
MGTSKDLKQWNGEGYHHHSQIQFAWAQEMLKRISFRGDEHVLDIGCGDGKITANIAAQVPQGKIIGIDRSESMIAFAQRTYSASHKNLHFELRNATDLTYQSRFDLVFSCACLQWIKNQLAVLEGVHMGLVTGGRFLAVIPDPSYIDRAIDTAFYTQWREARQKYVKPCVEYNIENYTELLHQAKLRPVSLCTRISSMGFANRDELLQWLLQVLVFEPLPKKAHIFFTHEVINALLAQHPSSSHPSGAINIPMPLLEVEARKQ